MTKKTGQSNLGAMARRLKAELAGKDVGALSHTTCMAVVAKVMGDRNMMTALAGETGPQPGTPPATKRNIALETKATVLQGIVDKGIALYADAFNDDEEVNGGDMVEAFTEWREDAKTRLKNLGEPTDEESTAAAMGIIASGRGTILLRRLSQAVERKDDAETRSVLDDAQEFLARVGFEPQDTKEPSWLRGDPVGFTVVSPSGQTWVELDARWFLDQATEEELTDLLQRDLGRRDPLLGLLSSLADRNRDDVIEGLEKADLPRARMARIAANMAEQSAEAQEVRASVDPEDVDMLRTTLDGGRAIEWLRLFRPESLTKAAVTATMRDGRLSPEVGLSPAMEAIEAELTARPLLIGETVPSGDDGARLFWNNEDGFVDRGEAERYRIEQATDGSCKLPIGGAWFNLSGQPYQAPSTAS